MTDKALKLLGLMRPAGATEIGTDRAVEAVRAGSSKVKIAISFYLSQACQQESTSKEQEQNEKLNVI